MGMNKTKITDESGVSLVELLAALALVSLVVILINTVFFFTRENADSISDEHDVQQEMLLAMKMITQDIRAADSIEIPSNEKLIIITNTENDDEYSFADGKLMKNSRVITEKLKSFKACHPPTDVNYSQDELKCLNDINNGGSLDSNRVIVILEGPENRAGNNRVLATEIFKRQEASP